MLELPEWLLAMAYAVLGWTVGLQFNKAIFLLALKTLPQIIASILGLILMCALMALALTHILQMDFMTAYLATSPGGLDTVAIIAAGTRADMSFIMALQTLRLFTILLTGRRWRGLSPAMRRGIKASQSEGWADRMSASAMRPGNLLSGFQGGQRGVVVRLFGDFVHQLAVDDLIVFIDYDHRTRSRQPADRWRWRRRSQRGSDAPRSVDRVTTLLRPSAPQKRTGRTAGQRKCTALRCCPVQRPAELNLRTDAAHTPVSMLGKIFSTLRLPAYWLSATSERSLATSVNGCAFSACLRNGALNRNGLPEMHGL